MTSARDLSPVKSSGVSLAATFAMRAASHLRGGFTLDRTLTHLSRDEGALQPLAERLSARLHVGEDPVRALAAEPGQAWRVIAAAWSIAHDSGAPAADSLERMSQALTRLEALRRRRDVMLASPKSSMLLISLLPLITILFGELFGLGIITQLMTPLGHLLLLLGGLFLTLGALWGWVMIRSLAHNDHIGGFELDLMWIALAGGSSTAHASRRVVDTVAAIEAHWVDLDGFVRGGTVEQVLRLASRTGVPVRAMMLSEADTLRDVTFTSIERTGERLGVKILLPLGLCVLPSFLIIGVLPMILSLLSA